MEGFSKSINKLKGYKFYARLEFKDYHHLIQIHPEDVEKTAFEANNGLYKFLCIHEGPPNAVATFQEGMQNWIESEHLFDTHAFRDEVIIGGNTFEHYKRNCERFKNALDRKSVV